MDNKKKNGNYEQNRKNEFDVLRQSAFYVESIRGIREQVEKDKKESMRVLRDSAMKIEEVMAKAEKYQKETVRMVRGQGTQIGMDKRKGGNHQKSRQEK